MLINLAFLDSFDEEDVFKNRVQMDLKKKPKRYIEYCVFEGVKADSLEYNQIAFLVAEDFPETQFYIRDKEGEKEGSALKFWCVDKYYPEVVYRFESNYSKMNY